MTKRLCILASLLLAAAAHGGAVIRMIPLYGESIPPPVMSNWPSGLIGYWGFDGTFNDTSTNRNWAYIGSMRASTLTYSSGPTIATNARVGSGCGLFTPVNSDAHQWKYYTECWQTNYNAYTNAWTFSAWIYSSWAEASVIIIPFCFGNAKSGATQGFRLGGYNDSTYGDPHCLGLADDSSYPGMSSKANSWLNADTGAWHHICIVWSNTPSGCRLYKDGASLTLSYTNTGGWPRLSPFSMMFGCRSDWGSWPFNGRIDEAALFNRCLSATEIQLLANPPTTNIPLPLGIAMTNDDSVLLARVPGDAAHWHVSDASYYGASWGNRNGGAAEPTWATNKYYSDGGDGFRFPDRDYFSFSNTAFTIGAWLKPYQFQTTNAILTKTTAATTQREWEMYVSATNPAVSFTMYDSQSNSATWTSGNLNLDTNLWFHAAFSLDGAHQVGRWYTNGALDTCTTQTTLTAGLRNTTNEIMWMLGNGSWTPFIGWYGNFDIYTNDLPSTVTDIFTAVTGVYTN